MKGKDERPVLGRHIPWRDAKERICRVVNFIPMAKIQDGKVIGIGGVPYAFLTVECEGLTGEADIWVTHRLDFLHVWQAFEQRDETKGEEVLVIPLPRWSIFPMLEVWLCPQGAFNKMTHPELQKPGEAGWLEIAPIAKRERDSK